MFTGNNISVAINYTIIYRKQYQCTAVHNDQSNHYYNFFSLDSHSHWLSQMPITKIIGVIGIDTLYWD